MIKERIIMKINIIEQMETLFDFMITQNDITNIIKSLLLSPHLTIFEAMNLIFRNVQIIKTLRFINENKRVFKKENVEIDENKIIKSYKVYKTKDLKPDWLYIDNSDKRRVLLKDENGYYNYIPLLNTNNIKDNLYAKNENEILYHFLYFKTLLCNSNNDLPNTNGKEVELCPYSHNILKDFRIIYDYEDEKIYDFMLLLKDCKLFNFENYLKYIPINPLSKIDSIDFQKLIRNGEFNNYHLYPFYHSLKKGDEPHYPTSLFKCIEKLGNNNYDENSTISHPEKCSLGIFCPFLYNKTEENFYYNYFKNDKKCEEEKKNLYNKESYGIDSNEKNKKSEEEEKLNEKKIEKEVEKDPIIQEKKNKINLLIKIGKYFRCKKCNNIPKNAKIYYFINCKHFLCDNCLKKIKKENKSNNKKINLLCPFCDNKIGKSKIVVMNFGKS